MREQEVTIGGKKVEGYTAKDCDDTFLICKNSGLAEGRIVLIKHMRENPKCEVIINQYVQCAVVDMDRLDSGDTLIKFMAIEEGFAPLVRGHKFSITLPILPSEDEWPS